MPLIYVDLLDNRTDAQVATLLDAVHAAVVEAFEVPERDRYQVVNVHRPGHMVVQDTGLGIDRTDDVVVIRVVSKRRSVPRKQRLYELLATNLARDCGIAASDLVVSVVENDAPDWSFGHGVAQFVTGDLPS
ncbi:tautomerase family protein [Gordonia rhizosphera]|uniref:Tautomerase n=1 Tax=Gordonia rhizosphera NBRC 16068 TaxID=1108045 RepID=K6WWE3_9ACTN|nr:tautomerase family protein [Gordonia rhizosphera]GAB90854.1 hypothetical protein GORHZ_118_00710 [Gordonia rhizosphera NBRC 16068]